MMLLHLRLKETRIGFSSTFHAVLGADGDLLCGWILTDRLLVGGMSDNQYMMKTRILFENQEDFANNNDFLEWSIPCFHEYSGQSIDLQHMLSNLENNK